MGVVPKTGPNDPVPLWYHRPQAGFFGRQAYPTLSGKGAALLHSLACNYALVDGNKRLALLATVVFLGVNGHRLDLTDDEAFDLTMSVARANWMPTESTNASIWRRRNARPVVAAR